ncbi:hypothetical protein THARTR1_07736 [Trichoderma harzianum]|uniref:Uncharacterized protein n=1 Tax=Trichoderma harzianum TaxID=5544 RepID=A0A2K0U1G6_TRIHA|nr:hypothetical protein THARTR1_07736 [Trichoderma harzianum]
MPSSPPQAAYSGSDNDAKAYATNDNSSYSNGIDRFLANQQQYNPGFGKVQSSAKAEASAKARVMAELRAFEKQFVSSGKSPSS